MGALLLYTSIKDLDYFVGVDLLDSILPLVSISEEEKFKSEPPQLLATRFLTEADLPLIREELNYLGIDQLINLSQKSKISKPIYLSKKMAYTYVKDLKDRGECVTELHQSSDLTTENLSSEGVVVSFMELTPLEKRILLNSRSVSKGALIVTSQKWWTRGNPMRYLLFKWNYYLNLMLLDCR